MDQSPKRGLLALFADSYPASNALIGKTELGAQPIGQI